MKKNKEKMAYDNTQTLPDIIKQAQGALAKSNEEMFKEVTKPGDYFPRLMLMGSNSDAVKEGKINQGRYAIVLDKQNVTDLDKEVDVLVIMWRPKALQVIGDTAIASYDPENKTFEDIKAKSSEKDSGCMYGPEFLLWVKCRNEFVTFHMSSKSARRAAPELYPLIGYTATLKCTLASNTKYKWHVPVITQCSTPMEYPSTEDIQKAMETFVAETKKEPVVEKAVDTITARAR